MKNSDRLPAMDILLGVFLGVILFLILMGIVTYFFAS